MRKQESTRTEGPEPNPHYKVIGRGEPVAHVAIHPHYLPHRLVQSDGIELIISWLPQVPRTIVNPDTSIRLSQALESITFPPVNGYNSRAPIVSSEPCSRVIGGMTALSHWQIKNRTLTIWR